MPIITDNPPQRVRADLRALSDALDAAIPAKRAAQNVLIATWNLKIFGSLTRKWTSVAGDSLKRDLSIRCRRDPGGKRRSEVAARHDELSGNNWSFLMTDVNIQEGGNSERIAFVFDQRRVTASGLAAELVEPEAWLAEVAPGVGWRQFVRTPYAVSFQIEDSTFILVTLHVAEFMRNWADRTNRWGHNLITLDDYNINRKGRELWDAFTSSGLHAPDDLDVRKTIFADMNDPENQKKNDKENDVETFAFG